MFSHENPGWWMAERPWDTQFPGNSGCRRDRKGAGPSVLGVAVLHPLFYCWDTPTPSQLHPSPFPAPFQPLPIPIPAWSGILKLGTVLLSLPLLPKISWAVNHSNISFIALKLPGRKPNACLNAWEFSGRQHFPWIPLCLCKEGAWAVLAAPAQIKQENGILIPPARRASLNSSFVKHSQPFFFSIPAISPLLSFPCPSLPCPGIINGNSANGAVLFPANRTPMALPH